MLRNGQTYPNPQNSILKEYTKIDKKSNKTFCPRRKMPISSKNSKLYKFSLSTLPYSILCFTNPIRNFITKHGNKFEIRLRRSGFAQR